MGEGASEQLPSSPATPPTPAFSHQDQGSSHGGLRGMQLLQGVSICFTSGGPYREKRNFKGSWKRRPEHNLHPFKWLSMKQNIIATHSYGCETGAGVPSSVKQQGGLDAF